MSLWDDLHWRGLVHQHTDPALPKLLDHDHLTSYVGFDPTAPSLHVGNLVPLLTLRRVQLGGHRVIGLLGGGTGLIGDPSGREEERQLLSTGDLERNLASIRGQIEGILGDDAVVVDNARWLTDLRVTDFLRDVGKHFSVNEMIRKESVRQRLEAREQGISYTEFSYMLLQAYDYLHLFDTHGCRLQLGGSDQWGNITEGIDLIRRQRGEQAYGFTVPLITLPSGTKMGKSASGSIWLDPRRTSPYRFYQYWVNAEDEHVGAYLRTFTFLDRPRIEELDEATRSHPERREAQRTLAWEVTALVHGEAEAETAKRAAEVLFSEEIAGLDEATLLEVMDEAPSLVLPRGRLEGEGVLLVEALTEAGLEPSRSAAGRTIRQGGAYVNNRRESDLERRLTAADTLHGRYVVLRKGKRHHTLLRFE